MSEEEHGVAEWEGMAERSSVLLLFAANALPARTAREGHAVAQKQMIQPTTSPLLLRNTDIYYRLPSGARPWRSCKSLDTPCT